MTDNDIIEEIDALPIRGYSDQLADAKAMDKETPPKDVEQLVVDADRLSAIERRRVFEAIKKATGIPYSELERVIGGGDDSDAVDHLDMARKMIEHVGAENVLGADSDIWLWRDTGVWQIAEDRSVKQLAHEVVPGLVAKVSQSTVNGAVDLFKTEVFKPDHEFDLGPPETVNTPNGELYLVRDKWQLQPHCREHYRTTQIPVEFKPTAKAPRFVQFLGELFANDPDAEQKARAILEMMGYTLMAHCQHEKFIILVGNGANGKSVLLAVLEALCGSRNIAGVQPSQFDNKFQRAHLRSKLANIVTEIKQGEIIEDAALKGIVSGEPSDVEQKFKDPFTLRPFATCWFGTNHMPHTRDFTDGLFRRALILTFNNQFKPELGNCDHKLRDTLLAELPGILVMALDAYASALQSGFTTPASTTEALREWRLEADQVAQFVDAECSVNPQGSEPAQRLYEAYKAWAADVGIGRTVSLKAFRERLTKLGYGSERNMHGRFVTGLNHFVKARFVA